MADENPAYQMEDQELSDLLDSALNDFGEEDSSTDTKDVPTKSAKTETDTSKTTVDPMEDAWTRDFIRQAAGQFEENLQNLIQNGSESELGASFQRMAQTVASVITDGETDMEGDATNADFQSAIARALNDLSATSENLQNDPDISEMFEQASMEDGPNGLLPFMQGMLQHLLSKEILYPSLKELVDKYPEWLEEKKATILPADLERFTKQLELLRKVCGELEKEKKEDTDEIKKRRFESIMTLMQEVQGSGHLPEELVGDQTSPFQMDGEAADSIIPSLLRGMDSPQNCCMM